MYVMRDVSQWPAGSLATDAWMALTGETVSGTRHIARRAEDACLLMLTDEPHR